MVKTMENTKQYADKSAQTCIATLDKNSGESRGDYDAELKTWVQQVILEAERTSNQKKKNQYLKLLKSF
jgi:hypothetical protein